MSAIVNDRDLALRSASNRLIATSVAISADGAIFTRAPNNGSVTPTNIVLTAVTTIFTSPTNTWYYAVDTIPGTWNSLGTGTTQTISGATFATLVGTGSSITYKVVSTQTGYITAENTFKINYTKLADESYTVKLVKTAVVINASSTGVPSSYTGSGATITVTKGSNTALNYGASGADTFSVGATPTVSPTTAVSVGTMVGSGTTAVFSDITNMLTGTDAATVTFTVTIRDSSGTDISPTTTVVQSFSKVKAGDEGQTGWNHYIEPDVIVLPVDANNNVTSYADATADYFAIQGATNDTTNWSLSKVDSGVTSTITSSGRITITNFVEPGNISLISSTSVSMPSGWGAPAASAHNPNTGTTVFFSTAVGSTKILRTTDWVTFSQVDIPTACPVTNYPHCSAAYANGAFVALRSGASTNTSMYSTDDGVTWNDATMPSGTNWAGLVWTGSRWLSLGFSATVGAQSTDGVTWSAYTATGLSSGVYMQATNGIGTIIAINTYNQTMYRSTNGGTSWSANSIANVGTDISVSGPWKVEGVYYFKGYFIIAYFGGVSSKYRVSISTDGSAWAHVATSAYDFHGGIMTANKFMLFTTTNGTYTDNVIEWGTLSGFTISSGCLALFNQPSTLSYIPYYDTSGNVAKKLSFNPNAGDQGIVTVTATKSGESTTVRTLRVLKGDVNLPIYSERIVPSSMQLAATSDGVVTNFDGTTFFVQLLKNGIEDTANWDLTVSVSDASITYTGSAGSYTLTGMGTTVSSGTVTVTASKIGQPIRVLKINLTKNYSITKSGPVTGATYAAFTTTSGYVALRFKNNGTFQLKYGSGGSFVQAGYWYNPQTASIGSSYWLRMTTSGDPLDSGTTGSWIAMSSDIDYVLSRGSSGTSTTNLTVDIGNSSSGGTVQRGYGTLVVEVP